MPKRLLILAYFFPPDGGGGAQRWAKFAKFLPAHGWTPTVVTRELPEQRSLWEPKDGSLADDVAGIEVVRVGNKHNEMNDPKRGDAPSAWIDAVIEEVVTRCEHGEADAVVITAPPYDLASAVPAITSRTDVPVILDLRDPWALDGGRLFSSTDAWRREHVRMKQSAASATAVIYNTAEAQHAASHSIPAQHSAVIPNGFDSGDLPDNAPLASSDTFDLVHLGTLHSRALYEYSGLRGALRRWRHHRPQPVDLSGRTLKHLLAAIPLLPEPLASRLRIRVIGPVDDATERSVRESGVSDHVDLVGYLPHREAVGAAASADALFLPLYGLPPGLRARIVPGKAYEYLALGRPILACVPEGDARDLMERSGRAAIADPCNPASIAQAIESLPNMAPVDRPYQSEAWLRALEREALTKDLAELLDSLSAHADTEHNEPSEPVRATP